MCAAEVERRVLKRKRANVYDAVAGRISTYGFTLNHETPTGTRDTISRGFSAIFPEEALFRRKSAPERYHEDDIYFQDRHLPVNSKYRIPESDLLKALHGHASSTFDRDEPALSTMSDTVKSIVFHSFDESALLCMGILLEELVFEQMQSEEVYERLLERQEAADASSRSTVIKRWDGSKWVSGDEHVEDRGPSDAELQSRTDSEAATVGGSSSPSAGDD